jgi:ribosome modulation factor
MTNDPPTEPDLQKAWSLGYEAGDQGRRAIANPYEPGAQRELHDAWEQGRQAGIRDH